MSSLILLTHLLIAGIYAPIDLENKARTLYELCPENRNTCEELVNILELYNENNNIILAGYKASATIIMAKHVLNPINKYSKFKNGRNLLEKCILKDPNNMELRFLRFSIQTNIPGFLRYNTSIIIDKKYILASLKLMKEIDLKNRIVKFLNDSSYLDKTEKQSLKDRD